MNRRKFVKTAGSSMLLAASYNCVPGANDRLGVALIGSGRRGRSVMDLMLKTGRAELVGLCDVYDVQRRRAREALLKRGEKVFETADVEEMLARSGVDAVLIATPDHLHYGIALKALEAGKHLYLEKPVTHSYNQGPPLRDAVRKSGVVCQTGIQQRSGKLYKRAKEEIFDRKKLGDIIFVRAVWSDFAWQRRTIEPRPRPAGLDWERFIGPAPEVPYQWARYDAWRNYRDYGNGILADLLTHWADVAQWMMDDEEPLNAVATGGIYHLEDGRENPDTVNAVLKYRGGWNLTFECTIMPVNVDRDSVLFLGTEGSLELFREGYIYTPHKGKAQRIDADADLTAEHVNDFFDAIKYGREPSANIEIGLEASRPAYLAVAAYWNGERMRFNGDRTAIERLSQTGPL